jgi:hypothetical protein
VTHEVIERRTLRSPGHAAPSHAVTPPEGEEWPMVGLQIGDGVFVGARASRYVLEGIPVADTTVLDPVRGVRLSAPERDLKEPPTEELAGEPSLERRTRSLAGWLVDHV